MNILVLGNGFDLAHGLSTKYGDFLEWVIAEYNLYHNMLNQEESLSLLKQKMEVNIPSNMNNSIIKVDKCENQEEIWECISDNVWINYFLNNPMYQKENWIDFENEISSLVQSIDNSLNENNFYDFILTLENKYFRENFTNDIPEYTMAISVEEQKKYKKEEITYKKLRDKLSIDLNRLIRALEIYLCNFIEKNNIEIYSPDIENIEINRVLSFNYTDTFKKIYGFKKDIEYDYIHGKADIINTIEDSNIVLGINEYLLDDVKNQKTEFIAFKKFYQRIHKETGCEYMNWIDEIREDWENARPDSRKEIKRRISQEDFENTNEKIHKLFIFGHSLDITDKDILMNLILNENIQTTIYYYNKEEYGKQIANLVKVLNQEELIKRTGGQNKTIVFKHQEKMKKM